MNPADKPLKKYKIPQAAALHSFLGGDFTMCNMVSVARMQVALIRGPVFQGEPRLFALAYTEPGCYQLWEEKITQSITKLGRAAQT